MPRAPLNGLAIEADHNDGTRRGLTVLGILLAATTLSVVAVFAPFVLIVVGVVGLVVSAWRWPVATLALVFTLLPFIPLPTIAASAAHYPNMPLISSVKEAVMVICLASLWRKNGMVWKAVDAAAFMLVSMGFLSLLFRPDLQGLWGFKDDFAFVLPYFVGRTLILRRSHEVRWVKVAIVLMVVLALGGVVEAILGPAPRALLYGLADPSDLPYSFGALAYEGFRPGSFTSSPLEFGPFCMLGLLLLVAYRRELSRIWWLASLPIFTGLVISLTRAAWLGLLLGAGIIALRQGFKLRFALLSVAAVLAVLALAPVLGMEDFLTATRTGRDTSLVYHQANILESVGSILAHPLGSGPGTVGPRASERQGQAYNVDGGYITFGLEYSILAPLVLFLFYILCIARCWHDDSRLGDFALVMISTTAAFQVFMTLQIDFNLSAWMLLPVGMSVRQAVLKADQRSGHPYR